MLRVLLPWRKLDGSYSWSVRRNVFGSILFGHRDRVDYYPYFSIPPPLLNPKTVKEFDSFLISQGYYLL